VSVLIAVWKNSRGIEPYHQHLVHELEADFAFTRGGLRRALMIGADSEADSVVVLSSGQTPPVKLIADAIATPETWAQPSEFRATNTQAALAAIVQGYRPCFAIFDREGIEEAHRGYEEIADAGWPVFDAFTYALAVNSLPDRKLPL